MTTTMTMTMTRERTSALESYTKYINSFPLLSDNETLDLFKIIKVCECDTIKSEAREKLINSNLRLVLKIVNSYCRLNEQIPKLDLLMGGNVGLTVAIDRFNPKLAKLSTFATFWIKLEIRHTIRDFNNELYIPQHIYDRYKIYKNMEKSEMDESEIKDILQITEESLNKTKMVGFSTKSLESEVHVSHNNREPILLKDLIPNNDACPKENLHKKETIENVYDVLDSMSEQDRDIIFNRYLAEDKINLNDLGSKYNITGEAIRLREVKALNRFKKKYNNKIKNGKHTFA